MNVQFVKFHQTDQALDYLENKWERVSKKYLPAYDDVAMRSLLLSRAEETKLPEFIPKGEMPSFSSDHLEVFSTLAELYMPNLDKEEQTDPHTLHILANGHDFPAGTVVLRKNTNLSEMYIYFDEFRVIDGTLYRSILEDPALEDKISSLPSCALWESYNPTVPDDEVKPSADAITMSIIASKILLGLISGASSAIGGKAVNWAFQLLGITESAGKQAAITYEELVRALKSQARDTYRQKIQVAFNTYERKLGNYNNGSRTEQDLFSIYEDSVNLVSLVQEDERYPDRVHYLAFVICTYLAVMQERAEWYRGKDEEKLKSFYNAFQKAAESEMALLKKVEIEAEHYRLAKISMYKTRRDFWGWLAYFDDVHKPDNNWIRYNIACIEWGHRGGSYQCLKWTHDTPSYRNAIKYLEKTRGVHVAKVHREVKHALRGLSETYKHLQDIINMEVPPPPPK